MKRRAFLRGLGAAGGFAFAPALGRAGAPPRSRAADRLHDASVQIGSRISAIAPGAPRELIEVALAGPRPARRAGRAGTLTLTATPVPARTDALDLTSAFRAGRAVVDEHTITIALGAWSKDNYLVLPGACYAGNRFQARRLAYPPLLSEPADIGPHVPPIVPEIVRLSAGPGPSALTIDAADLSTPALAMVLAAARLGIVVLTRCAAAPAGGIWLSVAESDDRARATVTLTAHGSEIPARIYLFDCADIPALFERLHLVRKELTGPTALVHERPFSAGFAAHEARVNERWQEKPGYLAGGDRTTAYTNWQTGWCGGLMTTLPLIACGSKVSRERAFATIAFVLDGGQAVSGFFHGISDGKTWFDDGFATPVSAPPATGRTPRAGAPPYKHARRWHLVRRTAEALTFLVKQLALLERHPDLRPGAHSARWAEAARRAADALVGLWERYKQLGQFVDIDSGELIVGGSTSAGLAPAGLALAAAQLKEPHYLQVAKALGDHYYDRFVRNGLTCGGPGDVLQAADSESAAALLDSFVTLFEVTRDRIWIDRARAAAHLLASWVISYDAPAAGRCAASGVRATGAVFWSAASGRGSPGYLVSSGDALFRLYRASGDVMLLELLRDTVHNLAQYLPDAGAPARADVTEPPRCPRADPGRWLEPRDSVVPADGVFDAIALLSYTEVPGIYVRPETGFVFVFDHLTARIKERGRGRVVLSIANPTRADATVRILAETAAAAAEPLRPGAVAEAPTALVPAGGTLDFPLPPAPV